MVNKFIAIPLLVVCGVFIPHIAGLLCMEMTPPNYLLISYAYYTIMFFLLWKGNKLILQKVGNKLDWTMEPIRKLVVLLSSYILFTGLTAFTFTIIWYLTIVRIDISWSYVLNMILILIISVLFISHIYETMSLISNTIKEKQNTDAIEMSMIRMELNALKAQIDPHFMFNSLNTLGFLIDHDREKATAFNQNLAELYQYVLSDRTKGLVSLKNEIEIAQKYFMLMKIRFGESIQLIINPNVISHYNYRLPSISIQTLIENAIKHNTFDENNKLVINISVADNILIVSNKISRIRNKGGNNGIGLLNLGKRHELLTGKSIQITEEDNLYSVMIPLLNNKENENTIS